MKKRIDFSVILIFIIIILIGVTGWLLINDDNKELNCIIRSSSVTSSNEAVIIKVTAVGKNAVIKTKDGVNTNKSNFETTVKKNGIYTFYVTDGKNEKKCTIDINTIIEAAPSGKITANTKVQTNKVTLTLVADNESDLADAPYSWDNKKWSTKNTLTVTKNGAYIGYIKGSNGKIGKVTYNVTNIGPVAVSGISLNHSSLSITIGESTTLVAKISPSNASSKDVTWSSSDEKIVTVSSGKITGKAKGKAVITATTGNGKTATCDVTITDNTKYAEAFFLNIYDKPAIVNETSDKKGNSIGLSALIKTLDDKYILIDTGISGTAVKNVIYNELKNNQKNSKVKIDYMIITHSHYDHIGNAVALIKDSNITTNKVIIKKESKSLSPYNKVVNELGSTSKIINPSSEGQKISVGKYVEIYIFNSKDVYANKTCHTTGDYYGFTANTKSATKINGKYYYFDGSNYPNVNLVATDTLVTKSSNTVKGMNNYFYAYKAGTNRHDCNANANSLAIIIKVKTSNGNRYMYIPGDLDNSGYDITSINNIYGNGLQIVFPDSSKMKKASNTNNGLFTGYLADINRVASETNAANNIKKVLGNDIKNITIYQTTHHCLNNAPDAINILGLNKSNLYAITPNKADIGSSQLFVYTRTYYYTLSKAKKLYPGGSSKNGVYCNINNIGATSCNNY